MSEELIVFKDTIIENFKVQIGPAWEKLTKEDKDLLEGLAKDAAKLHWDNLCGKEVGNEVKVVNASLMNLTIAKYLPVKNAFWKAVERAATVALTVLIRAALGAVVAT